jgi:hypothetical protein
VLTSDSSRFTARTLTVTSANGEVTRTYTIGFQRSGQDHRPYASGGLGGGGNGRGSGGGPLWSPATEWAGRTGLGRW